MGSPVSPVEVCNLSLDLLRHNQLITSIETPETEEEALAARWYDALRRSVLRMFPWNFARVRSTLSRISVAPEFGYSDAYQLPNNYLNYVFIGEDPVNEVETDIMIEGRQLLINNSGASSLDLCYIYDIQDVVRFDPVFLMLLVTELAVVFGNSITGLNKSTAGMEKLRDRWEAKARIKNAQENPPRIRYNSPLLTKRRGARRSGSSDGVHLFS
jgi:hypothetical protein